MAKLEPPYETYVDQIIEYKEKVLTALSQSQEIMALLADNPEIDLESEEAEKVIEKCLWDYQYVDETTQSAGAYIMVEAAKTGDNGGTLQEFALYVEIVASTEFVPLNHKKFLGMNGNRLDNIAKFVDAVLSGSRDFGIGRLKPKDIRPVSVPKMFRAIMLTYEPVDFSRISHR